MCNRRWEKLCSPLIKQFFRRSQKIDKGAVMTLIFKECGSRLKEPDDVFTLAVGCKTNRVLLYCKTFSKMVQDPGKIDFPLVSWLPHSPTCCYYLLFHNMSTLSSQLQMREKFTSLICLPFPLFKSIAHWILYYDKYYQRVKYDSDAEPRRDVHKPVDT